MAVQNCACWSSRLNRPQICNQIVDLTGLKHEFRHLFSAAVVNDNDAFGERFGKIAHVIALVQDPEWWRRRIRARAIRSNGVTPGTVLLNEILTAFNPHIRRCGRHACQR